MKTSNRDFSLDLLRALACIMVFGVHFVQRYPAPGILGVFFEKGTTGVGFFFILSGYLAYYSLEKEFSKNGRLVDVIKSFYIKRAIHILPLYYLVVLIYFVFFSLNNGIPEDSTKLYWIRYLFFLNRWVPSDNQFWMNLGATWSISVFVLFYILAPFIYLLVKKSSIAGICVVVSYGALRLAGSSPVPIMYLFFFFLGILVYLAEKEKKTVLYVAIESLIILVCVLTNVGNSLVAPVIASLFMLATRGNSYSLDENSIFYKGVTGISKTSYSIYLIHVLVFIIMDSLGIIYGIGYIVIFLLATIVLTAGSYYFVEIKLAKKALHRLLKK